MDKLTFFDTEKDLLCRGKSSNSISFRKRNGNMSDNTNKIGFRVMEVVHSK